VRLVFFGSPAFAVPVVTALTEAGHEIALVVSQPARPVGRRGVLTDPPVAHLAKEKGLPLFQPPSLKPDEAAVRLSKAQADAFVVAAYGKILSTRVLALPRLFCVNVHGSILPRWRGASPVQAALLAGDERTGVSIMKMEAGMDTGPVFAVRETEIGDEETADRLGARLARIGADLLVETLARLPVEPVPQDDARATYCPKISREDGLIDWARPAAELARRDRAFTPWPGLFTFRRKARLKLSGLQPVPDGPGGLPPGTVVSVSPSLVVACGVGAVAVRTLQAEGRKAVTAADFVRGERVAAGDVWPS
jgi:methionyl-tRNA formyltransferase